MVPIYGLEETSTWQILTGQTSVLCGTPAMVRRAKDAFLNQMVGEPTRITETKYSIPDLFLTNNDTFVNQTRVIPRISDHEAVFVESSLSSTRKSPLPRQVYKYHRADYDGFKKEFREFARDSMSRQQKWTVRLSGHSSRQPSTDLWRNTSNTRQYVVTRSPNLG